MLKHINKERRQLFLLNLINQVLFYHDCCYFVNLHYLRSVLIHSQNPSKLNTLSIKFYKNYVIFFSEEMASPRTRRVLAELRPKDENNVS